MSAGSWPIEVGWRLLSGESAAHLIRPAADWDWGAWDEQAEALHGVSQAELVANGKEPEELCNALNSALVEHIVYSDAPDWDGFWLYRLFNACGVRQAFSLTDFSQALDLLPKEALQPLIDKALEIAPHTHRAADDVLHMSTLYELVQRKVDEVAAIALVASKHAFAVFDRSGRLSA